MSLRVLPLVALTLSLLQCRPDPSGKTGDGNPNEAEADSCTDGAVAQTQLRFVERSADWGLAVPTILPTRLSAVDIDGDGLVDIYGSTPGNIADRFDDGIRYTWLLRNTGRGFEDVTEASGFLQGRSEDVRPSETVVWADVDNDGDLDAYSGFKYEGGQETAEILLNVGGFRFEPSSVAGEVLRDKRVGEPAGAVFTDINRDGYIDLWVAHYDTGRPDQVLLGSASGYFNEAGPTLGINTKPWSLVDDLNQAKGHSRAWGASACDLNGDGTPELMSTSYGRAPNHLWESGLNPLFHTNRSIESGFAYDENLDWTTNAAAQCYCAQTPTAEGCPQNAACRLGAGWEQMWDHGFDREPFRLGGNTALSLCGDIDNDGDLDVMSTGIAHWWAGDNSDQAEVLLNPGTGPGLMLERMNAEASGLRIPHQAGTDWNEGILGALMADFDHDGRLDVLWSDSQYPDTRARFFRQTDALSFEEVALDIGVQHPRTVNAVAADFDLDGDLDLILAHSANRCAPEQAFDCYPAAERHLRFFENVSEDLGGWVRITLEGGEGMNRSAIGAQVEVDTPFGPQLHEISGGHGHYGGQQDLSLHLGLGNRCEARLKIRWPDAELSIQEVVLEPNHAYHIKAGEDPAQLAP